MTYLKNDQEWPYGVISPELDLLESILTRLDHGGFEQLYHDLSGRHYESEKADYLLLLKIERELVLGHIVDADDPVYLDLFKRRIKHPRVIHLKIRALLSCDKVSEAKDFLHSSNSTGLSKQDFYYLQSRICLKEQDENGWLSASRNVLELDPIHRDVVYLMASFELKLSVELDAIELLKNYHESEPLDLVSRSLLKDFASNMALIMKRRSRSRSSPS